MVSGTPSAVPLSPPKLERMSLRTTPVVDSTFGPLEPSPGYGPCVSSGILVAQAVVVPVVVVVDVVVVLVGCVGLLPQPKSDSAPAPRPALIPASVAIRSRFRRP